MLQLAASLWAVGLPWCGALEKAELLMARTDGSPAGCIIADRPIGRLDLTHGPVVTLAVAVGGDFGPVPSVEFEQEH